MKESSNNIIIWEEKDSTYHFKISLYKNQVDLLLESKDKSNSLISDFKDTLSKIRTIVFNK